MKKLLLIVCLLPLLFAHQVLAQGVTSAALNGIVKEETGSGLPGATVLAIHTGTGAQYGTVTDVEGRYNFPNVRTGEYIVTISFIGYQTQEFRISLALGKNLRLDASLTPEATELDAVEVVASRNQAIDPSKTGAATNVSQEQVQALPTISRSLADYARLSPQFSSKNGGLSFAGQNNRFNNISFDGALNNDVFGLTDGGTPGDRQGAQPISLDAIKEIQIVIAPFDVRQSGFTGGGVNAITRNGENEIEASVYFFGRNDKLVGNKVGTESLAINEFYDYQSGFRIGGPIIKNKLFYFFNYDRGDNREPSLYNWNGNGFSGGVNYNDELNFIDSTRSIINQRFGYDAGDYREETFLFKENQKFFLRFDYNINQKHKLTWRISYTDASTNEIFRNRTNFGFNSSGYDLENRNLGNVVELQSMFSNTMSNELRVAYNRIRDISSPRGDDFPSIRFITPKANTISTGLDRFRGANSLDQDLIEITDNFTLFKGKHVITVGTRNEIYGFDNLFIPSFAGEWTFSGNLDTLRSGLPDRFVKTYSITDELRQPTVWSAILLGAYAQDEWNITPEFRLTLGLRADVPIMLGEVARNRQFEESFGLRNDITPKTQVLWSPRIGYNWNLGGKDNTQIRGGLGIFTGKAPFVWLSNQYSRDGVSFASTDLDLNGIRRLFAGMTEAEVNAAIANPYFVPVNANVSQTVEINITNPNFRIPQIARANVAVDQKTIWDVVATLDFVYSKTLNDIYVRNINLQEPSVRYTGEGNRGIYTGDFVDSENFTNIYVLENTSEGYQYNLTAQLQKNTRQYFGSVAYNFGEAKDKVSLGNSTASGNFQNNIASVSVNDPAFGFSDFDQRHRVIGAFGYTFNYSRFASTQVSFFYTGQSGSRYDFTVAGDLNGDRIFNNDLFYVPKNREDITLESITIGDFTLTSDQAYEILNDIIESEPGLKNNRGKFADKNAGIAPWNHQIDLRVLQDISMEFSGRKHTIQLSMDILNVGNLANSILGLDKTWGAFYFGRSNIVQATGFDTENNRPIYRLTPDYLTKNYELPSTGLGSVWKMQLGIRYIF
ncbi:carboxypeptidase regulatory-like domain-containing protein [Cytophagales bacterium LB-30]|uniref:Carboxypeptidase regulatory-like domain-containing protein n=1 Tax=Shiella aurantiaca TaxID=3058365 RepID=A0ABT8F405_9BACT|nr:carboxypeptidase regulatory-like domain-containing protein [Shiella aurantiaca]MDN4165192.1 carboxypeptidase regulatory-like domain-containing protein [Shiella aurantiaca]